MSLESSPLTEERAVPRISITGFSYFIWIHLLSV
jgi:hypothetical protein